MQVNPGLKWGNLSTNIVIAHGFRPAAGALNAASVVVLAEWKYIGNI